MAKSALPKLAKLTPTDRQIAEALRQTKTVVVGCRDDVDTHTCKMFGHALHTNLHKLVSIYPVYESDESMFGKTWFVPPRLLPDNDGTVRLIEDGPPMLSGCT